ncbi:sulfurtransferase TusA family protein [Paracoccus caeni]|uniref:Sulfurtransferase TusA family protein n=1 Tax=Paracoccus caeni TaxID=657651 RepID=A0A934SBW2_9RHOB|nr:sulfurtransferase TusA family protein [Paracoccus caeni]MBK4214480.1 sulfurtransferase TusA family protein [Paracoccus caeni]
MAEAALIDARGLLCPLPVLRLRKVLLGLPPGAQVRMVATDAMALVDVPHFCEGAGHVMIAVVETGDGAHEFTVERGPSAPSTASGLTPEDI